MGRMGRLFNAAARRANRTLADVKGVGVAVPGMLDVQHGVVVNAANLEGWKDVPLAEMVATTSGIKSVVIENDANAALLAEVWVGVAQGKNHVAMLTLDDGVGGAIMC